MMGVPMEITKVVAMLDDWYHRSGRDLPPISNTVIVRLFVEGEYTAVTCVNKLLIMGYTISQIEDYARSLFHIEDN